MGKNRHRRRPQIGVLGAVDRGREGLDFHGRRYGKKLRPGQRALVDNLLPKLRLAENGVPQTPLPSKCQDTWLEIGFGAGEHLAAQAASHPDIGFIGCEPFINGVARLLTYIDRDELDNVRILDDDARPLLDALPEASIGRVYLLFADPWPKARHHKRRFVCPENLDRLARVLKDDGELRFASDHPGYVAWALEQTLTHADFDWTARRAADWRTPPADWVATRYEQKALAGGVAPSYLLFRRRPRTAINP